VIAARTAKRLPVVGVLDFDVVVCCLFLNSVVASVAVILRNSYRIGAVTKHLLAFAFSHIRHPNTDRVIARMNCRHVMQKCRLLDKPLVALRAFVAKLVQVALDVVVHGVLACKGLVAALVAAHEVTLCVLGILNWHSCTVNQLDNLKSECCYFNF
jgi:hypothetical protein